MLDIHVSSQYQSFYIIQYDLCVQTAPVGKVATFLGYGRTRNRPQISKISHCNHRTVKRRRITLSAKYAIKRFVNDRPDFEMV
jgi:hypothetical protein